VRDDLGRQDEKLQQRNLLRNQSVVVKPKCCRTTKMLSYNQNVVVQPKCCRTTKMLSYNQSIVK
jgi:hypothetical protein